MARVSLAAQATSWDAILDASISGPLTSTVTLTQVEQHRHTDSPHVHILGMWEETGGPREKPCRWVECATDGSPAGIDLSFLNTL